MKLTEEEIQVIVNKAYDHLQDRLKSGPMLEPYNIKEALAMATKDGAYAQFRKIADVATL